MWDDYKNELNELRKNIEIMESTFEEYGIEVLNVGIQFDDNVLSGSILVFCEIMNKGKKKTENRSMSIKVNVYDSDNILLSMGQSWSFKVDKLKGYDTIKVEVKGKDLFSNVVKLRVYAT